MTTTDSLYIHELSPVDEVLLQIEWVKHHHIEKEVKVIKKTTTTDYFILIAAEMGKEQIEKFIA